MPDVIITPSSGIIEFKPSSTTVNKIEASGTTFNLVNNVSQSGTIFNIEGTNGSLFSVVDNLNGTLMSVNNNAGIPVLEVFSDDRVIAGRFGQNDFVVSSSGNIGIGTNSPTVKLDVNGIVKTTQLDVDNIRLDSNTISVTNTNGNIYLSPNGLSIGQQLIISQINGSPTMEFINTGPDTIIFLDGNGISGSSFKTIGGYTEGSIDLLYIDHTNGEIGIGHNTPLQRLHVTGGNILCDRLYMEKTSAPTISGGSLTLNLNNGSIFLVSLNAAITTITISNTPSTSNTAVAFSLIFTADGTARSVTWPASVKWAGGTAPTLTSTNAKKDILSFVSTDQGTTWFGFVGGQNY